MHSNPLKSARIPLLAMLILLCPGYSFGWGRTGHHIVAEIAMQYLPQQIKEKVQEELGSTTPEDAATWMDDMRVGEEYDYMKPWHFIYIPKGEHYKPGQADNLITALNYAFNDIRLNRADERRRKQDVMILFHLIGDMHQPLHAAYEADKGGNTFEVNYDGNNTSMHHVWDDDIINSQNITAKGCLIYTEGFAPADLKAIQSGNFISWMEESRVLLRQVYDFGGHLVDKSYLQKNTAVVEGQLLKAGIRLAYVLQILFGPDPAAANAFETGSEAVTIPGLRQEAYHAVARAKTGGIYTPQQAAQHIGETATVCGKVYGGTYNKALALTILSIGAASPQSPFTIEIIGKDRDRFGAPPEKVYDGLDICITGLIKLQAGKAKIIVSKEEQIQIR